MMALWFARNSENNQDTMILVSISRNPKAKTVKAMINRNMMISLPSEPRKLNMNNPFIVLLIDTISIARIAVI